MTNRIVDPRRGHFGCWVEGLEPRYYIPESDPEINRLVARRRDEYLRRLADGMGTAGAASFLDELLDLARRDTLRNHQRWSYFYATENRS